MSGAPGLLQFPAESEALLRCWCGGRHRGEWGRAEHGGDDRRLCAERLPTVQLDAENNSWYFMVRT